MVEIKSVFLACLCAFIFSTVSAQDPVRWTFSAVSLGKGKYEVHARADIASPWHLYSQLTPTGGPEPTVFKFVPNPVLSFDNKVSEVGNPIKKHEAVFDLDVIYFDHTVDFVRVVTSRAKTTLSGSVRFMVCNDKQCLPPKTIAFTVDLK